MKIVNYASLIRELPYRNQSFDIERKNWNTTEQDHLINQIFDSKKKITLTRADLVVSVADLKDFILKTLLWGYPTKGRGNNINRILQNDNFKKLEYILEEYKWNDISFEQFQNDINSISGLGLATMSKFTYFLNTTINGNRAVILDKRIRDCINSGRFQEFNHLKGISDYNAINRYPDFIRTVDLLSQEIDAKADQIEMFLFTFGKNLSALDFKPIVYKPEKTYRNILIENYQRLIKYHNELFNSALNLGMSGELKDINDAFDIGDIYNFDIEQLKGTNDTNLNIFIELYEKLNDRMNTLVNINAIKEEELNAE